ncbi:hypothetical protein A9Q93_00980 [Nonlabens dokdonensis]|uniref:Uncharacterized protein n=1 Tax=Nonlabens dokdonensis TaxID=328515 RepID=A0A1Z8BFP1_9FLAO|nr:hypothetical protein [Nonlabens dokdonensis]OUS21406.1 hypothetical protein A9Q93_00980 [Nonlabens dokdonensis]
MKKLLVITVLVQMLSIISAVAQDKFVGKWTADDGKEIGFIEFQEEGYAALGIGNKVMGGKEFTLRGKKGSMTYVVSDEVLPIKIDLVVTKLESGEQKKLLCIARFINDNEMLFAMNFNNQRPIDFTENNAIILKRE